ncbi:MAG: hypothetical protein ACQESB_06115 [Elusimicrobiota bacterium]
MKKFLGLYLSMTMLLGGSAFAGISEVSRRSMGINPNLTGIISDEYTDFMSVNTANITEVQGYRIYTQLSNLGLYGTDKAIAGVADDSNFFAGSVTPLSDMLNIGAFASLNRNREKADIRRFYFEEDSRKYAGGEDGDGDGINGDYEDLEEVGIRSGEYSYRKVEGDENQRITRESGEAVDNANDINLNLLLGISNPLDPEEEDKETSGLKISYLRNTQSDIDYKYSYLKEDDEDETLFKRQDYNGELKIYSSTLSFSLSARNVQINDLFMGASLSYSFISQVDKESADAEITEGSDYHGGSDDELYKRTYRSFDTEELDGFRVKLNLDSSYPLTEKMNLKTFGGVFTRKLSGQRDTFEIDNIAEMDGPPFIERENWSETQTTEREKNKYGFFLTAGIEKQAAKNLVFGSGVGFKYSAEEDISDEGRKLTKRDSLQYYSTKVEKTTREIKKSSILVPTGIEWNAAGWLDARIGATYRVDYKRESTTKQTDIYEHITGASEVISTEIKTTSNNPTPVSDSVDFFCGLGISLSENFSVDVTNISAGQNILDLSSWEFSAILKF